MSKLFSSYYMYALSFQKQTVAVMLSATSVSLLLVLVLQSPTTVDATYITDDTTAMCSRHNSKFSCIVGCLRCAKAYGRKSYDMGACCHECAITNENFVDDGPEFCSERFFLPQNSEYMKGKRGVELLYKHRK